jgi:uncharacterized membrane protein YbhN (UPF0104 family)
VFPFAVIVAADTLGWRFAFARDAVPFHALLTARLAGEAFNTTTPTASVGGEAVKAWLLRPRIPLDDSLPSVIIAKTTITIAQGLFLLCGILLAWPALPEGSLLLRAMTWLLVAEIIGVAGFVAVQIYGVMAGGGHLLGRLGLTAVSGAADLPSVDTALAFFYRRQPGRLLLSVGWHFVGWVLSGVEIYVILLCLGTPVPLITCMIIEACSTAIRFATFFMPGGSFGALEGGHVVTFVALGLEAGTGLSFSVVRRLREAAWVGAGLVVLGALRRSSPGVIPPPVRV